MVKRDEITEYLYSLFGQELLDKAAKIDPVPNSVQIKGQDQVSLVALGVSASPDFIAAAIKAKAQYLIVHHGLHTGYLLNGRFDVYENRLRAIFKADLTLAGFHYALDSHPEIGNNAQIIKLLGAEATGETYFDGWGYVAKLEPALTLTALTQKAIALFKHEVYVVPSGPRLIRRLGVCSGGAVPRNEWFEAIDKKIDLHLTGEIKESAPSIANEARINYLACGHYATEVFGLQALANKLKSNFNQELTVKFIDIPTTL